MSYDFSIYYTPKTWAIGIEVGFPSRSEKFFLGTKLRTYWCVTAYFGPLTLELTREPTVIERERKD